MAGFAGLARWAPLTGVVSVLLWILALFALDDDRGDTADEIVAFYDDAGNRDNAVLQAMIILAAVLFFIWFLSAARARLEREGGLTRVGALMLAGGMLTAGMWAVADMVFVAMTFAAEEYGDEGFVVDGHTARLLEALGYGVFTAANMLAIVFVTAASALALRTAALPRWLAWIGFAVAAFLVVSFVFVPFLVLLGWVLVVSLVLLFWQPPVGAPGETPTV